MTLYYFKSLVLQFIVFLHFLKGTPRLLVIFFLLAAIKAITILIFS